MELNTNEREIMNAVRRQQPIARSRITELTSITQQSVHRLVEALTDRKLLTTGETLVKGKGKPSPQIILDNISTISLGVAIRADRVDIVGVNLSGQEIYRSKLKAEPNNVSGVLNELADICKNRGKNRSLKNRKIIGIGIAMQGYRNKDKNKFTTIVPLENWSRIAIDEIVSNAVDLPAFTENNATCGGLAELHSPDGCAHKSLAYLSFNFGFGSGIIWENQAVLGGYGNAGELGYLFTDDELKHRPALGELIARLKQNGVEINSISELHELFDPNWPGLAEWLQEIRPALNLAIRAIRAISDPEAIYFGGEAPTELRKLMIANCDPQIANRYGEFRPFPELLLSKYSGDAAVIGAAALPARNLIF